MSRSPKWKSSARKIGRIVGVLVLVSSLVYYGVSIYSMKRELDTANQQLHLMQQDFEVTKQELTPDISIHKVWSYSLDFRDPRDAGLGLNSRTDR